MYIEGRKDKPYSESLFNQLRLLAMLVHTEAKLPDYIIDSRLHKSERTYSRYFLNLHKCGLIPKVKRSVVPSSEDELSGKSEKIYLYGIPYKILDWSRYYISWSKEYCVDHEDAILTYLNAYSKKHFNPHDRLYRLGRVLICSYGDSYWNSDFYLEDDGKDELDMSDMSEHFLYKDNLFHIVFKDYEDLYEGISLRTRQRDFRLLREVIAEVLLDQDALG